MAKDPDWAFQGAEIHTNWHKTPNGKVGASRLPCIEELDGYLQPAVPATTDPPAPWDRAARLARRGNFSL